MQLSADNEKITVVPYFDDVLKQKQEYENQYAKSESLHKFKELIDSQQDTHMQK